jgi:hypothetical protein
MKCETKTKGGERVTSDGKTEGVGTNKPSQKLEIWDMGNKFSLASLRLYCKFLFIFRHGSSSQPLGVLTGLGYPHGYCSSFKH